MNYTLLFVPLVAAAASWLMIKIATRYFLHTIFKKKNELIAAAAHALNSEIIRLDFINKKLTSAETLYKAMPAIEAHIDNFLHKKLKEAIPVISMFIGEKITAQLKELFLEELKDLFPSVMSQFIGNLSQSGELEKEIALKLQTISIAETKAFFYQKFRGPLRKAELGFACTGLLAGIIQLLLTLMLV
jgi:hypothetical protein